MQVLSKNDTSIIELTKERDALALKVEDLVEKMKQKDAQHEAMVQELQEDLTRTRKNYKKSQQSVTEKELGLERLKADLEVAQDRLKRSDIDAKNAALMEKDAVIRELKIKLEESYKDFELLSLDWDKLDLAVNSKVLMKSV